MSLQGASGLSLYLFERNSFLECGSPWALEPAATMQKSASDPGGARVGGFFSMSKDVSQCSLGDSVDCPSMVCIETSSCAGRSTATGVDSLHPSDFLHARGLAMQGGVEQDSSCGDSLHPCDFPDARGFSDFVIDVDFSQPADGFGHDDDVPADANVPRPSIFVYPDTGCEAHQNGTCKPCKYVTRRSGCRLGDSCIFCHCAHLPGHPGTKWRPSKEMRKKIKEALSQMTVVLPTPAGNVPLACEFGTLPPSITSNPYLMQKLEKKFANHDSEPQFGVVYRL